MKHNSSRHGHGHIIVTLATALAAALLAGAAVLSATTAHAQARRVTGRPIADFQAAQAKVTADLTSVAKQLEALIDTPEAEALATSIPGVSDGIGAACWKSFGNLTAVLKAHPLPATLRVATDIEAARLAGIALAQICANPNCGQMWTDALNVASAISVVPPAFSFPSLCARVPTIGTVPATVATPAQPEKEALGPQPAAAAAPAASSGAVVPTPATAPANVAR